MTGSFTLLMNTHRGYGDQTRSMTRRSQERSCGCLDRLFSWFQPQRLSFNFSRRDPDTSVLKAKARVQCRVKGERPFNSYEKSVWVLIPLTSHLIYSRFQSWAGSCV